MGAWFPKDKGGNIQTFGLVGKSQISKGEPIKPVNYLSCLIHPIIYYYQKLVELVIAWDGQGMAVQIRIWEAISFWETRFWLMGQVIAQKCYPFPHASTFLSSPRFWSSWALSFTFLQFPVFFPHGWEVVLLTFSGWDLCWAFLWLFSSLPGWEKRFWVAQRVGEETHNFWVLLSLFWPR